MTKKELLKISKPLICNEDVAKCFAENRKTETRRLPKSETSDPRYKVGDILWIREPAKITICHSMTNEISYRFKSDGKHGEQFTIQIPSRFINRNSKSKDTLIPRLPIWMVEEKGVPNGCIKEMARMFYKVTEVREQELQHISIVEIIKEGFVPAYRTQGEDRDSGYEWWVDMWNKTAPKGKQWEDNPLIEVYKLERVEYA